ncbi:thioredoxin family protein [Dyella agri]|uniref:Thioredoxin family protein n=1 Tax=Dyella agri TaxID=1926869 RepID=A0ABW8KI09_9GAMM
MKRDFFRTALACGLLALGSTTQAQTALTDIDQAVKAAQAKQLPVFIDFSAIWCHSCHEMDAKVLNGTDWDQRQSRFVLVRSDADSVNGSTWMKKLSVPALPTYVVLNPDGSERGRLTGEFTRAKFYPALDRLLSGADSLSKLKADALHGSTEAVAKVLRAYRDRNQQQEGLRWYASLPVATRNAVKADPDASTRLAAIEAHAEMTAMIEGGRRDMIDAELRKETDPAKRKAMRELIGPLPASMPVSRRAALAKDCRVHAQQALNGPMELEQHFDIAGTLLECTGTLPKPEQKALVSAQLPALKALYDTKIPTAGSGALRGATYTLASYYRALGDSAGEQATYQRAIAIGRKALGDGHGGFDVKRDQAMAEVFGEFLSRYGSPSDKNEDLALQKAMVEAYPDNAFYQTEYGGSLLRQGHAAAALPYLQRAADNASAQNKLGYTHSLAKALIALNRRPEAEKLFNAALQTAEKQFPTETKMEMTVWKQSGGVL